MQAHKHKQETHERKLKHKHKHNGRQNTTNTNRIANTHASTKEKHSNTNKPNQRQSHNTRHTDTSTNRLGGMAKLSCGTIHQKPTHEYGRAGGWRTAGMVGGGCWWGGGRTPRRQIGEEALQIRPIPGQRPHRDHRWRGRIQIRD